MAMALFKVFEGASLKDEVYFVDSMSAAEVRRSLINHDGHSNQIDVYKMVPNSGRYSDCARAHYPEECK